eukprot:TRINITY_DN15198_c0_g2_i1.p2 TRINITY_DN15198_c0_g2~~TRINITY_DN15198_c0_g2_i1.p2  ORF type:complete len:436 (+),score=110.91 TRINITY_DN15198_c0_g2_i1:66-1310(+)
MVCVAIAAAAAFSAAADAGGAAFSPAAGLLRDSVQRLRARRDQLRAELDALATADRTGGGGGGGGAGAGGAGGPEEKATSRPPAPAEAPPGDGPACRGWACALDGLLSASEAQALRAAAEGVTAGRSSHSDAAQGLRSGWSAAAPVALDELPHGPQLRSRAEYAVGSALGASARLVTVKTGGWEGFAEQGDSSSPDDRRGVLLVTVGEAGRGGEVVVPARDPAALAAAGLPPLPWADGGGGAPGGALTQLCGAAGGEAAEKFRTAVGGGVAVWLRGPAAAAATYGRCRVSRGSEVALEVNITARPPAEAPAEGRPRKRQKQKRQGRPRRPQTSSSGWRRDVDGSAWCANRMGGSWDDGNRVHDLQPCGMPCMEHGFAGWPDGWCHTVAGDQSSPWGWCVRCEAAEGGAHEDEDA